MQFITQMNGANADVRRIKAYQTAWVLFDASGGKGVSADQIGFLLWQGVSCGYAGGLGPATLLKN